MPATLSPCLFPLFVLGSPPGPHLQRMSPTCAAALDGAACGAPALGSRQVSLRCHEQRRELRDVPSGLSWGLAGISVLGPRVRTRVLKQPEHRHPNSEDGTWLLTSGYMKRFFKRHSLVGKKNLHNLIGDYQYWRF